MFPAIISQFHVICELYRQMVAKTIKSKTKADNLISSALSKRIAALLP